MIKRTFSLLCYFSLLFYNILLFSTEDLLLKLRAEPPVWMKTQVEQDCKHLKNNPVSLHKFNQFFNDKSSELLLIKFTISNNQIILEGDLSRPERWGPLHGALLHLSQISPLPDCCFLFSWHDGLSTGDCGIPIFVMAKTKGEKEKSLILIPDFEVLRGRYQVLANVDITTYLFPWEEKYSQLIWRGSTAQYSYHTSRPFMQPETVQYFSRVNLCEKSLEYPHLINAKFTLFVQGGERISYLQNFGGEWISFEDQMKYKYHILIDGNACAYSNSGWKLFTNSLIFKPDSPWIQWYHQDLKPYVHYIPLKINLENLVEQLEWAQDHEEEAQAIAWNMCQFARERVTVTHSLAYLYHLINECSQVQFIE